MLKGLNKITSDRGSCGVHWRRVTRASGSKESEWALGAHRETVPRERGRETKRGEGSELARIRSQVTVSSRLPSVDSTRCTYALAGSRVAFKDGAPRARMHAFAQE